MKLVIDVHPAHTNLETINQSENTLTLKCVSETLINIINAGERNILHWHGITVIIADGICHCKVGLVEQAMFNMKKCLINIFPTKPHCSDLFELNHRLAIIKTFINERPTFTMNQQYFTLQIFQIATLKRSQRLDHPQLLSDLVFPTNSVIKESLYLLSNQSKQILTGLAADLSKR